LTGVNWPLREAIRKLRDGGIIAYPTETVYGLGCEPRDGAAVLHLLALKQRRPEHGVILLASELAQLEPFLRPLTAAVRRRIGTPSRLPVTWTVPCRPDTPYWLTGDHDSLAVRITAHPVAHALCEQLGGTLVSTSANLHGRRPASSALAVRRIFNGNLDAILHGDCGTGRPSSVRDAVTGRILRN